MCLWDLGWIHYQGMDVIARCLRFLWVFLPSCLIGVLWQADAFSGKWLWKRKIMLSKSLSILSISRASWSLLINLDILNRINFLTSLYHPPQLTAGHPLWVSIRGNWEILHIYLFNIKRTRFSSCSPFGPCTFTYIPVFKCGNPGAT